MNGRIASLALAALLVCTQARSFDATDATAMQDAAPVLVPADCEMLAQAESDPRHALGDVACGYLDVPENWDDPGARRLRIGYAVLLAESRHPAADPLLYLSGGPGGSALAEISTYAHLFAPIRRDRDILLFDQRGAAFSDPLRCNDWTIDQLFDLSLSSLLAPEPGTPDAPRSLPDQTDAKTLLDAAREELGPVSQRCAEQFRAAGIDLSQYTSVAIARDAMALVDALGYDQVNLYGISYGTRLALTIARDFPDRGIRGMVLDSVFPPEINGFEQYPAELPEVASQLFADCRRDLACNTGYPDLGNRVAALLPALAGQPLLSQLGPVGPDEIVAVFADLSVNVEAAPYIPRMIAELERGEVATWEAIVTGEAMGFAPDAAATPVAGPAALPGVADLQEEIIALAAQLGAGDSGAGPATGRFVDLLTETVEGLPRDEAADLALRSIFLSRLPHQRESLEQFVKRSFPGASNAGERFKLLRALYAMPDEEIAALFTRLQEGTDALDPYAYSLNPHLFSSVECNEEIPFESLDVAVEVARAQPIPEFAAPGLAEAAAQFAICEVWTSGRAAEIERLPVRSNIPTLILSGSYDAQTPVSWAKSAFVTLPNATFVLLPMTGHGALQYSSCAERIVRTFIDGPGKEIQTACVATLRPRFLPPSGPLILPAPSVPATPEA
jgi:pimeloyl-ACP methyl ester carboxylesterase